MRQTRHHILVFLFTLYTKAASFQRNFEIAISDTTFLVRTEAEQKPYSVNENNSSTDTSKTFAISIASLREGLYFPFSK